MCSVLVLLENVSKVTPTLPASGHMGLNCAYANWRQVIKVQAELFKSSLNWNKRREGNYFSLSPPWQIRHGLNKWIRRIV